MKVEVGQGNIEEAQVDAIVVNLFQGVKVPGGATGAVDRALNGAIQEIIAAGDITGKLGEVAVIYPRGLMPSRRVLIVGLGKLDEFNLEAIRCASAAAIKRARELNSKIVATIIHGSGIGDIPVKDAAQATIESALLAEYRYAATKKDTEAQKEIELLKVVELDHEKVVQIQEASRVASALASGVYLARDLVNLPPNIATPTKLAQTAQEIADRFHMRVTIGDRDWAKERKMGAYLAVAQGAGEEPKFIVLEHNHDREDLDTIVLVGKGITFDTGGISIKPSERMGEMKSDMGGAAAVLGTMHVVGALNLPLRVIGIAPATENMPDAYAYRPADVITASNGKTIEIISTDAEGRMILADALVLAGSYQPKVVVDLATLTGACVIALGESIAAGLFCNDEGLEQHLISSGKRTNERLWSMPLWDDYKKAIRSDVADMKNSGGRSGGVGTSAIFLKEFTNYPWAHLDIAPMALSSKENYYISIGGTGFGVRLLVDFLRTWS